MSKHYLKYIFISIVILFIYSACSETVNIEEERDKEAETYFMGQLTKEMNESDILETNLTNFFTKHSWTDICFTYDKQGDLLDILFLDRGFLFDIKTYLNLSEYLDIDKTYTKHIRELDPKTGYSAISTLCGHQGGKFIFRKVKDVKDKYIMETKHNPYKNKYKENIRND